MTPEHHVSPLVKAAFGLALAAAIVVAAINIVGAVTSWEGRSTIVDFHAFYLVGGLVWSGHYAEAYRASAMAAMEQSFGGRPVFMPWSYPPLFGLVAAALAALPLGTAYLAFVCGTLGVYLWGTARLAGEARWPVMLASFVSIVLNLRCGQNGLLTAGIVAGVSASLLKRADISAGLGLALMAIKPHLIPLVPVVLVLERRWAALTAASLGALVLSGVGVLAFGPGILDVFLASLSEVGRLMAAGAYPLHRMTSIFAACIGVGMPPGLATLVHAAVAVALLVAVARLAVRDPDPRLRLGLGIMAGLFISPYVYDYDQTLFGVGLMLVWPALRRRASARRQGVVLVAWAGAQSLGMLMNVVVEHHSEVIVSPMGPAMLAVFGLILEPLWRSDPRPADAQPAATGPAA